MSTTEYIIRNAGQYESTLASTGTPIRTTTYGKRWQAVRDLARVVAVKEDEMPVADGGEGETWYVYRSEEDRDNDPDGSRALAIIATKASYEREVEGGVFED
jgi:hypothetical protein